MTFFYVHYRSSMMSQGKTPMGLYCFSGGILNYPNYLGWFGSFRINFSWKKERRTVFQGILAKSDQKSRVTKTRLHSRYVIHIYLLQAPPAFVRFKHRGNLSQLIESNTYMYDTQRFDKFFGNLLSYNLKCLIQQNNLINTLIWHFFWNWSSYERVLSVE
jgi:hypothetical protein